MLSSAVVTTLLPGCVSKNVFENAFSPVVKLEFLSLPIRAMSANQMLRSFSSPLAAELERLLCHFR
ncbi:hypothetical protein JCM6292_3849 [Bacteroides pyogenes JCM 6292]|uniref:Uncharacterized protein n=1 Tax=Bacteroides pyogenes JCM 6292 TaxID=1235809 RepID=W4PDJ2_9BACE|nr:hypothetical protein JCM6292_3849 [Bacteroides pyogenes JCM 6292]